MIAHFPSRALIFLSILLVLTACSTNRLSRQVKIAEEMYATQTAEAQKLDAHATQVAAEIIASLTAAAPTATHTPLPPTATPDPTPTVKLSPTTWSTSAGVVEAPLELKPGWELYEVPTLGVSIALPEDWVGVPIDEDMQAYLQKVMDTSLENDPALKAYVDEQLGQLKDFGIGFWAFDLETAEVGVTNLSISQQALPLPIPLKTLLEMSSKELEKLPNVVQVVSAEQVTLPVGEVGQLRVQLVTVDANGGEILVESLQYLLIREKSAHWLTFACRADLYDQSLPIFEDIADTLRWIES